MTTTGLDTAVQRALEGAHYDDALRVLAEAFGAVTATLHRADGAARALTMVAQRGLPDHVAKITATIPYGKGMAGICAERLEPVTVCNLQTDDSGVVRPGAKETGVAGALVVPLLSRSGTLAGTLGIGKSGEHDYTDAEIAALEAAARTLAARFEG